ncbi:protein phosphatase 1 regulatory subunit 11 [Entomortierella parvispora]|uniref:Type 1 phosphatases regulator n=1 Tax=Entomortierella parvispora TaxID=205924 RepID=A0A9P3H6V4_9FUNG|nr:protein phosphatase 1 regulatory subunit 11 [Entomortierella parvispora]
MAPTIHGTSRFTNTAATTVAIVNRGSGSDNDSDIPVRAGAGAGSRARVAGSGRRPATHGSRTMILDPTETIEEGPHQGILDLTGEPDNTQERRVQWDDNVIDNEHMNKKKSKICCIFKKQREFGESSDESSSDSDSSGSESDGGPVSFGGRGNGKGKEKRDAADGDDKDGACEHAGDPNHHHHHHKPKKSKKKTVNAYERAPKVSSAPKPINAPNGSN